MDVRAAAKQLPVEQYLAKGLPGTGFRMPNVPVQRRRGSAVRYNRLLGVIVALGAGVQHGWLSPTQRTERIRIPERARQSPRTVALPRPAGPARLRRAAHR